MPRGVGRNRWALLAWSVLLLLLLSPPPSPPPGPEMKTNVHRGAVTAFGPPPLY